MDGLRDRFIKYVEDNGVKQKFISKNTGIPEQTLSKFKKGVIEMGYNRKKTLDQYLFDRGY